ESMEKPASADYPIHELLARRWSARAIDPTKPVDRAALLELFEAARWAPSCFNEQPWRFLVFDGATDPAGLEAARECLSPGNAWAKLAPVLILTVAFERFAYDNSVDRWAQHDLGMASENFALQ